MSYWTMYSKGIVMYLDGAYTVRKPPRRVSVQVLRNKHKIVVTIERQRPGGSLTRVYTVSMSSWLYRALSVISRAQGRAETATGVYWSYPGVAVRGDGRVREFYHPRRANLEAWEYALLGGDA